MAGEIDNLNFKVILNDKEFQATIDRDTRIAKKFNTTLSDLLDVKAKGKGVSLFSASTISDLNTIKKGVQEILDKMGGIKTKASEIKSEMKESGASMEMVKEKTAETKDLMGEVAKLTGIAFGAIQIKEFIGSLVRVSGEFETQKMALTSMLQSADDANMIFSTLRKNALESPYTFQDLTKYAKQLVAFNISTDKLIETEKMLADVAAGLDVDMGRIILAYGQVKAAGALKGQELRQFTEAGVPLLQSLADQIERTEGKAVSLAQVFNRISKKEIPFEMVEQAFKDMTAEGGKFYNMQEVLVETLKGKIGKLRDVWQQALYDMGNANSGYLKDTVDLITRLVANMDKIGGIIKAIIVQYGAFAAILATIASGINLVAGAKTLANLGNLVRQMNAAKNAAEGLAIATTAAKTASFALAALATAGFLVYDAIKKANEAQTRFNKTIQANDKQLADEIGKLEELYYRLRNAKKGTDDWNNAKAEAVQAYSKYDKNLADEIDRVGSLALSYDDLKTSIEEATRTRQLAAFEQQEQQNMEDANNAGLEKLRKSIYKKYSRADAYMIMEGIANALRTGGSYQSLIENGSISALLDQADLTIGKDIYGNKNVLGNKLKVSIQNLLSENIKRRGTYLDNVRTLVKEYGLQGTPLDPDFNGPILGKTTNTPKTQPTWGNEGWQNSDKVSKEQKARIKNIMDIQAAYKDLNKAGYSEEQINQIIDAEFAWVDEKIRSRRDFWEELKEEADAMKDANAANSLRGDIAKGQAKEAAEKRKAEIDEQTKAAKEAEKALQIYNDALKSVLVKDNGTVNKALSDYQTELNRIDRKYEELAEKAKAAYPDVNRLNMELQSLGFYKAQEKAGAQGKFVGTFEGWAKSIIDEGMFGYDMTNWADKDVFEIRKIAKALSELEIPQEIKDALLKTQFGAVLLANLTEEVDKLKKKLKEGTLDPAFMKSLAKTIGGVAKAFDGVYDAAKEYAETVNPALAKSIEEMEAFGQMLAGVAKAALKGDWISAVALALAFVVEQFIRAQTEAEKFHRQAAKAAESIRHSLAMSELANIGKSIFGTDELKRLRAGIDRLNDLNVALEGLRDLVENQRIDMWGNTLAGLMGRYGLAVYDENGMLNKESIAALKELGILTSGSENIVNAIEEYYKALELVNEVMTSLVGNIADSAADMIVDTWIEAGNAALDYADILDDVARAYSKLIIKDMIMQALPENLAKNLTALAYQGNEAEFMSTLADALSSIEALQPYMEKVLTAFDPYFVKEGDTASSVGAGIKSITEDTAGLLAAYLNAIRADVAMGNVQRGEILSLFKEYLNQEAAPSYAEYLARIDANTANILATNTLLLSELRSIITPESGLPAVRIQNA